MILSGKEKQVGKWILQFAWLPKKVEDCVIWLEFYKAKKESYTSEGFDGMEVTRYRDTARKLL